MDLNLYFSFLLVSVGIIILPGPNVVIIVANSLAHGKLRGMQTVAGTSLAMCLQLLLSSIATAWFVKILTDGMFLLKYAGVIYLFYLAIMHLKSALISSPAEPIVTATDTFSRGFWVSLSNPKTMLFFTAILSQFVSSYFSYGYQISLLSVSFLVIAILLDSSYVLFSVKFKSLLKLRHLNRIQNGICGLLFLCFSVVLASSDSNNFNGKLK